MGSFKKYRIWILAFLILGGLAAVVRAAGPNAGIDKIKITRQNIKTTLQQHQPDILKKVYEEMQKMNDPQILQLIDTTNHDRNATVIDLGAGLFQMDVAQVVYQFGGGDSSSSISLHGTIYNVFEGSMKAGDPWTVSIYCEKNDQVPELHHLYEILTTHPKYQLKFGTKKNSGDNGSCYVDLSSPDYGYVMEEDF
jgi:hypothetical protein